jgi:hypothetical protein
MNPGIAMRHKHFRTTPPRALDHSGANTHIRTMHKRLNTLENHANDTRDRLARIETTLEFVATAQATAVTKEDLRKDTAVTRAELRKEMADMKVELRQDMADMKVGLQREIADSNIALRTQIEASKYDLVRAMGDMNTSLVKHMETMRHDLMKWSAALVFAMAGLMLAVMQAAH